MLRAVEHRLIPDAHALVAAPEGEGVEVRRKRVAVVRGPRARVGEGCPSKVEEKPHEREVFVEPSAPRAGKAPHEALEVEGFEEEPLAHESVDQPVLRGLEKGGRRFGKPRQGRR